MASTEQSIPSSSRSRETAGLVVLFGTMYFVQGIAEPTEGLIAQPVRSMLKSWGYSAAAIASFGALLALPWSLKPLYGLLTDFVPIARTRRRSYLILASLATVLGLGGLFYAPVSHGAYTALLAMLLIPTVGVAFSDVVIDAYMVEQGQPRGLTGILQSVQWASMYAGTILTGLVGGFLSQHGLQPWGFFICAAATLATLLLTWFFVHEEPRRRERLDLRLVAKQLIDAVRTPGVRHAAAFLFLWSFNPFSMSVFYSHLTGELAMSEQFYGVTVSLLSVGAILGSLAYGFYCRRAPMRWLIHMAIAAGVLSTLAYCLVTDPTSAGWISVLVGFTYMSGSMVQYDLTARVCPLASAGTTFAVLMSLSNLSMSLSTSLGGYLYDRWTVRWGAVTAFHLLVVVGALTTAMCWLVLPLRRLESESQAP